MRHVFAFFIFHLVISVAGCCGKSATNVTEADSDSSHQDESKQSETSRPSIAKQQKPLTLKLRADAKLGGVIRAIYQDSHGVVWIGGEGDLFRIDHDAVTSYDLTDDKGKGVTIKQIVETADGVIWCGTTGGLTKIEGGEFSSLGEKDGLISRDVWSLAADDKGTLWVGTIAGVCQFDGRTFSRFEIPKSKPDPTRGVTSAEIVHCITIDSRDRVWFGTNGGAYIYDGKELTRVSRKDGLPGDVVHRVIEDRNGEFWIGTSHNGICRFDGQEFVNYSADGTIEANEIWCIHEDRDGYIWLSGKHFGAYRFNGRNFKRFGEKDGLESLGLMNMLEDSQGRMWLGGAGGLFRYQDRKFIRVTESGPWD